MLWSDLKQFRFLGVTPTCKNVIPKCNSPLSAKAAKSAKAPLNAKAILNLGENYSFLWKGQEFDFFNNCKQLLFLHIIRSMKYERYLLILEIRNANFILLFLCKGELNSEYYNCRNLYTEITNTDLAENHDFFGRGWRNLFLLLIYRYIYIDSSKSVFIILYNMFRNFHILYIFAERTNHEIQISIHPISFCNKTLNIDYCRK